MQGPRCDASRDWCWAPTGYWLPPAPNRLQTPCLLFQYSDRSDPDLFTYTLNFLVESLPEVNRGLLYWVFLGPMRAWGLGRCHGCKPRQLSLSFLESPMGPLSRATLLGRAETAGKSRASPGTTATRAVGCSWGQLTGLWLACSPCHRAAGPWRLGEPGEVGPSPVSASKAF